MSKEKQEAETDDDDFSDFEEDFIPCSMCDGHPACMDFGCAYEHGLGHLVKKEPGNDFDY